MKLIKLLEGIDYEKLKVYNVDVGICITIPEGDQWSLFSVLRTDGGWTDFAAQAIDRGAKVLVLERDVNVGGNNRGC